MSSDGKRPNVYAIARSIWDHDMFPDETFTQREAWMWLIGAAAWKDSKVRINGTVVAIKRGEFCFAVRFMAEKFRWSKSKTDRFIQHLQKQDMIRDTSRDNSKVYSLVNYNRFQVVGLPKRDTIRDENWDKSGTSPGQVRDKEETGETGKQVPLSKDKGHEVVSLFPEAPKSKADQAKAELYRRGREILGQSAGGVITNLLKLYDGKTHKALAKLEDAATMREPERWLNAFLWSSPDGWGKNIEVGPM